MKVLIAIDPDRPNSIIANYIRGLKGEGTEVMSSLTTFWKGDQYHFDAIHIHWPESLLNWERPTSEKIAAISQRILFWKSKGSRIIATSHNYLPHRKYHLADQLYGEVYQHLDGMIHMGKASKQDFFKRYPHLDCLHSIIPHPWYDDIPNSVSREEARMKLGLPESNPVFLAFGVTRSREEQDMIIQGYTKCPLAAKHLLFTNGFPQKVNYEKKKGRSLEYLRAAIRNFRYAQYLKFWKIQVFDQHIPLGEIQFYFKAADVLVIQRIDQLNSGNLPLGFTFGKVVIGPSSGNIGEILQETGNPVFDPRDKKSIGKAMEKAMVLSQNNHGEKNYEYAAKYWNLSTISKAHVDFYKQCITNKLPLS